MGYSTNFSGELKFKNEITSIQLSYLNDFLGRDRRDIGYEDNSVYEDGKYGQYWYHVDLELLLDFSGIQWNGMEKTCELHHILNWLTHKMREKWPDFELTGELLAQGEEIDDRWRLVMADGVAKKIDFPRAGQKVTCPRCDGRFFLEDAVIE